MRVQRAEVFSAPSAGIENRGRVEKMSLTFRKETSNFGNLTKWKSPFLIKLRSWKVHYWKGHSAKGGHWKCMKKISKFLNTQDAINKTTETTNASDIFWFIASK